MYKVELRVCELLPLNPSRGCNHKCCILNVMIENKHDTDTTSKLIQMTKLTHFIHIRLIVLVTLLIILNTLIVYGVVSNH